MRVPTTRFSDQIAVITGASDGIGLALAAALLNEGATVVGTGRDQGKLSKLADLGALALTLDLGDRHDLAMVKAAVLDRFGRVDLLVNNAGQGLFRSWSETTAADWERQLSVNLLGAVRVTEAFLPCMVAARRGVLVNVASIAGLSGYPEQTAYCASKHAMIGWSRALSRELKGSGVRVCTVCPGVVRTGFFAAAGASDFFERYGRTPMTPDAAAAAILGAVARGSAEAVLSPASLMAWARGAGRVPLDLLKRSLRP